MNNDSVSTVWIVRVNSDLTEGRGPMVIEKIFSEKELARHYIEQVKGDKLYYSGNQGYYSWHDIEAHKVYHTRFDSAEETRQKREKALAKLTADEKKLLGLE